MPELCTPNCVVTVPAVTCWFTVCTGSRPTSVSVMSCVRHSFLYVVTVGGVFSGGPSSTLAESKEQFCRRICTAEPPAPVPYSPTR